MIFSISDDVTIHKFLQKIIQEPSVSDIKFCYYILSLVISARNFRDFRENRVSRTTHSQRTIDTVVCEDNPRKCHLANSSTNRSARAFARLYKIRSRIVSIRKKKVYYQSRLWWY